MPGDAVNSGIGFLDVQFGALEFGSDSSSLDGSANEKYNSTNNTIAGVDISSGANTANTANTSNSLDIETTQTSTTPFNASSQMVDFTFIKSNLFSYLHARVCISFDISDYSCGIFSYRVPTLCQQPMSIRLALKISLVEAVVAKVWI